MALGSNRTCERRRVTGSGDDRCTITWNSSPTWTSAGPSRVKLGRTVAVAAPPLGTTPPAEPASAAEGVASEAGGAVTGIPCWEATIGGEAGITDFGLTPGVIVVAGNTADDAIALSEL